MSRFLILFFFGAINFNLHAAAISKLVDVLVSSNEEFTQYMVTKVGLKGADALSDVKEIQHYLYSSLNSLNIKPGMSETEVKSIINSIPLGPNDENLKKEILRILEKNASKATKNDVVHAINKVVQLARKLGRNVVITCENCANSRLASAGFDFTVKSIENTKVSTIIENGLPKDSKGLTNFISVRAKKLGLGDYANADVGVVSKEDEVPLAVFLELAQSGTNEQKAMAQAIKKVAMVNNAGIFNKNNPQKFYKVFYEIAATSKKDGADAAEGMGMKEWTDLLEEVGARAKKDGVNAEEAFYRTLKDKPGHTDDLMKQLKKKRCFFK